MRAIRAICLSCRHLPYPHASDRWSKERINICLSLASDLFESDESEARIGTIFLAEMRGERERERERGNERVSHEHNTPTLQTGSAFLMRYVFPFTSHQSIKMSQSLACGEIAFITYLHSIWPRKRHNYFLARQGKLWCAEPDSVSLSLLRTQVCSWLKRKCVCFIRD